MINLENELKLPRSSWKTNLNFLRPRRTSLEKEFYATTIKKLEEDAQLARRSIKQSFFKSLPAIPFVNEMEENLADSEVRMQALAERFDREQARASEVIDGLQMELDAALIRQKQAINELNVREKTLSGKTRQLLSLEKKRRTRKSWMW